MDPNGRGLLAQQLAVACLGCLVLAVTLHFISPEGAVWSAARIVSATLTVLIVPGALLLLIAKLDVPITILEVVGLGAALTLGILTLCTIVCMLAQIPVSFAAYAAVIGSVTLFFVAVRQKSKGALTTITCSRSEWLLLAGIVVVGFFLFLHGSPLSPGEDQIHIAVVRRLTVLQDPSIYNVYLTPGLVYTYPFPVTHVIYALTSIVSGLDPLLVYHKMRFIWAVLAILSVFLATKRIFDNSKLAFVSGWTCIVLVAAGVFAEVSPLMWAQLAPFSHASDVAMGVLLPLLLVSTFYYLGSESRRDTLIFLLISLLMILTLVVAKIREIVQFMVYASSFLILLVVTKQHRPLAKKMAILVGAALAVVGLYVLYHRLTVTSVSSIVDFNRGQILGLWENRPLLDWIARPFNDDKFVNNFNLFFNNINAIVLLCSPLVLLAFFRNKLLSFVLVGVFAYLIIIRFPFLSVPYLTFTYFDMLSTPVRNVIYFIFVLTGPLVYIAAILFSKIKPLVWALVTVFGAAFAASASSDWTRDIFVEQPDWFFLPLLIALPMAYRISFTRWAKSFGGLWRETEFTQRPAVLAAVFIGALSFFLFRPDASLALRNKTIATDLEQVISLATAPLGSADYVVHATGKVFQAKGTNDVPTPELVQWMKQNIPSNSVLAVNIFNGNILTTFVPQRVPAWPLLFYDPVNYCRNFPDYCKEADSAFQRYGTQPFFNGDETNEERLNFIEMFDISYVVVDPGYCDSMGRVLGAHPERFLKLYDQSRWSVYKVKRH